MTDAATPCGDTLLHALLTDSDAQRIVDSAFRIAQIVEHSNLQGELGELAVLLANTSKPL